MRDEVKAGAGLLGCGLGVWVMLFVVAALTSVVWLFLVQPALTDQNLKITRQTDEFVRTKQELLLRLASDHEQLAAETATYERDPAFSGLVAAKRSQQRAIVDRLRLEASYLKAEYIPPQVLRLLGGG